MFRILDLSAGNRAIWFNKSMELATFIDIRKNVKPDVVCDSRQLPLNDGLFDLIVFDPPHVNFGEKANMSKSYGYHNSEEIQDIIKKSAKEAHRVSNKNALLVMKWNDHDKKIGPVLGSIDPWWQPLFAHRIAYRLKHASSTYWAVLMRREHVDCFELS